MKKAKYLVVDTTGFIRNLQLQELAENVISLDDVLNEIKCRKQLKRLAVIPYDLEIKTVFPENIKTVSEFSKKTGDYPCLSAVDMKVLALTYQLEKEHVGTDHIKTTPVSETTVESYDPTSVSFDNVAGFYNKDKLIGEDGKSVLDDDELISKKMEGLEVCDEADELKTNEDANTHGCNEVDTTELSKTKKEEDSFEKINVKDDSESKGSLGDKQENDEKLDPLDSYRASKIPTALKKEMELNLSSNGENSDAESLSGPEDLENDAYEDFDPSNDMILLKRVDENDQDDVSDDDSIFDDDDCGWITPSNIAQAKRDTVAGVLSDQPVTVACLTTDFAMQNVLKQMGLNVMSVDGRIIEQMRTYILRCHACGKTTSIMTKIFCPKCGLKTLKRVAFTLDAEGKQHIFINYKRQITARGKRWSIPKPQGGKHANNPILVEDQRVPQQRLSRKARQRTDALDPDYIAGFSPFVMRDTTSKSIMLGFHTSRQNVKTLLGRNPNRKKGKKKA